MSDIVYLCSRLDLLESQFTKIKFLPTHDFLMLPVIDNVQQINRDNTQYILQKLFDKQPVHHYVKTD